MQALVGQQAPFEHGREQLKVLAGLEVTAKSVERMAEAIGADIAQREEGEIEKALQLRSTELYDGHQVNANNLKQGPVAGVEYVVNNWTGCFGQIQASEGQPVVTEERFKEIVTARS